MLLSYLLPVILAFPVLAGSSNSLLDVSPDGKLLLAANSDNNSITVIDIRERKALREIPVGLQPEGVAWIGNGPLALVTLYRDDQLVWIDTSTGKIVERLKVDNEPYGVVATRDNKRAYVTHDYPGKVSEIDIDARKVLRTILVAEWCRGLAISPDEKSLYVTNFYDSTLYKVDVASGKVVDTWKGDVTQNLCRNVVLHPKRDKAYLSHTQSRTHVFNDRGSIVPEFSIVTTHPAKTPDEKRRVALAMDTFNGVYVTATPWESALTPDGKKIFTIYAASEDMNVSEVIDDDYREIERIGPAAAIRIGNAPKAVRVNPLGNEVYVYNTLDFAVAIMDAKTHRKEAKTIKVCDPPHTPEWVRGKILWNTASPPMTRARWISCAACHPDGLTDGKIWQNPEGPRRTPPLIGLAHTHPLHWSADRDEVQDFEFTIRGKLMRGRGLSSQTLPAKKEFQHLVELEVKTSGNSKDLDALALYTNSFPTRLSPHIPAEGKLSAEAERGKAVFFSKETNCASCHSGPYFTDSNLKKPFNLHDVGTGNDPVEKMGPKFDTPTLVGVYRNTAWLHHGKAKSLMEVLTTYNPKDQHGKTSQLTKEQKDDLVAFLKSLPYEMPPEETPNTVPYRLRR
jgi:YVTN family beta-propeller protein